MGFAPGPGAGGSSSIAGSSDVALSGVQNNHVLAYSSSTAKWQNALTAGGGGGGVFLTVASKDAPATVKARADYVCDGSDDQVEINAALEAAFSGALVGGPAGGTVLLSGGAFVINSPVLLRTRTTLAGSGWGTQLEPTVANTQAVVSLGGGNQTHMTELRDLTIHGRQRNAHGIHYVQTAGSFDGDISVPDGNHRIRDINIFRCGSAENPRDGILLEGTNGGGRGTHIKRVRIRNVYRHGINIDGFSDCKVVETGINCHSSGNGHGIIVGGGNAELQGVKAWYTQMDGFHVTSARAVLIGCVAQDAGRHGFYLPHSSGTSIIGGQADSCGRVEPGDGYYLAGGQHMLNGVRSADRGQTPNSPQRYGFNFVTNSRHFVTGVAANNSLADVNGSLGSNTYVRIMTESGFVSNG